MAAFMARAGWPGGGGGPPPGLKVVKSVGEKVRESLNIESGGGTPVTGVVGGDESSFSDFCWCWATAWTAAAAMDLAPTMESMEKPSLEEPLVTELGGVWLLAELV